MDSADLHREVIKLLIQVAWADKEIADEERGYILDVAQAAKLADDELEDLRAALRDSGTLLAPDLESLKRCRDEVKRVAETLIRIDQRIAPDEVATLESIDRLLAD